MRLRAPAFYLSFALRLHSPACGRTRLYSSTRPCLMKKEKDLSKLLRSVAESTLDPNSQVITRVSHLSPTTTTVSQGPLDTLGTRVLFIDLTAAEKILPQARDSESLLQKIMEVVQADRSAPFFKRFDSLKVYPTGMDGRLEDQVFRAVDGISPKYFEVGAGWLEVCRFKSLSQLEHPWTELETVKLSNFAGLGSHDFPENIFSIPNCLILDYCNEISITNLTELKTIRSLENGSVDNFVEICENNPVAESLEILEISSSGPYDLRKKDGLKRFHGSLRECGKIRELTLRLNKSCDTGHATYFPHSLEKLEFCGSTSPGMLDDLDIWIQLARLPAWLPRLKSIRLRFDTALNESLNSKQPSTVTMAEFEERRDGLYELLRGRGSPILTIY